VELSVASVLRKEGEEPVEEGLSRVHEEA